MLQLWSHDVLDNTRAVLGRIHGTLCLTDHLSLSLVFFVGTEAAALAVA
jgi:hypothetical protein